MFDLTNRKSFEDAAKWKNDVDSKCVLEDGNPVPCMLLANKVQAHLCLQFKILKIVCNCTPWQCDLRRRQVEQDEIESLCRDLSFIGWTETSGKDDLMVGDSMR